MVYYRPICSNQKHWERSQTLPVFRWARLDSNQQPTPSGLCWFPNSPDYTFTLAVEAALGGGRLVSTPSPTQSCHRGLARDCRFRGFPEFDHFHLSDFSDRAHSCMRALLCR